MNKHTPGPWRSFHHGGEVPTRAVGVTPVNGRRGDIAHCAGFDSERTAAEEVANAKLIASAPDLLDALITLLHAFPGDYIEPPPHITKAREAIAKASH